MWEYDVVVIGGGTAGSNAARTAAQEGAKTLLIHKADFLNLCVERGCMPSKSLLAASEMVRHKEMKADMEKILARKDEHVERFMRALQEKFSVADFDVLVGEASFLPDGKGVLVERPGGETTEVWGDRYVIATGTETFIPPIPGIDEANYITSDDIMDNKLRKIPSSIIIVGGGPIGLEFATFFSNLGSDVSLIERGPLLARLDQEFGVCLKEALEARGIVVYENASVVAVRSTTRSSEVSISIQGRKEKEVLKADTLFISAGRAPELTNLKLKNIGLSVKKGNMIMCDAAMCTENERVFAAGDVTRELQLLHAASEEGKVAGYNAAHHSHQKEVDFGFLSMSVIFSDPMVAHVGLSVKEAEDQKKDFVVSSINLPETGRAITMGIEFGTWQLVVERGTGKILGSTIIGPQADELIQQVFLVKQLGGRVDDIASWYAYHPTLGEQFITLCKRAAEKRHN